MFTFKQLLLLQHALRQPISLTRADMRDFADLGERVDAMVEVVRSNAANAAKQAPPAEPVNGNPPAAES